MGLFSFISFKKQRYNKTEKSYNNIKAELTTLRKGLTSLNQKIESQNESVKNYSDYFQKILLKQKASELQLEEIMEMVLDSKGESEKYLLESLLCIAGCMENFYILASEDKSAPLFEQADMMWNLTRRELKKAGITVIDKAECPLDYHLHEPERTEWNPDFPVGYILDILKYGYVYNGRILKRASVLVNKEARNDGRD